MTYTFKPGPELFWAALTAVVVTVLQVLTAFDPNEITEWRPWIISLGAASLRAAAGAILGAMAGKSA